MLVLGNAGCCGKDHNQQVVRQELGFSREALGRGAPSNTAEDVASSNSLPCQQKILDLTFSLPPLPVHPSYFDVDKWFGTRRPSIPA